ncbi:alanine--tRNA ligase [Candidatus Dojkabacteria bacterium]|nr:alanine--tRNA ligase [Candidatus Dojkabacteria bacterium]
MNSLEIKKKFIEFFRSKGHKEIPNVPLIPENDPTSLFIMAGMQPLSPYFGGEPHPTGDKLVNIQRCVRTDDIEEVGDTIHQTFFEMLGYWSLGAYFKKEAIEMSFEFYTSQEWLGLDPERIYATVFEGDNDAPRDEEAIEIWKKIFKNVGIRAEVYDKKKKDNSSARIFPLNKKENWWGPVGESGPCGPDSEFFYWRGKDKPDFSEFVPYDNSNMFIEIGNDVFMAYNKTKEGKYEPLKQKNIDFGGGMERIALVCTLREKDGSVPYNFTNFNTDLFDTPLSYLRSLVEDESRKSTREENEDAENITEFDLTLTDFNNPSQAVKAFRVILDHTRACTFLVADGIEPSNKDQGYILRRLLRRSVRHAKLIGIEGTFTKDIAKLYIDKYKIQYPHLADMQNKILNILEKEEINFENSIKIGAKEIDKLEASGKKITGKDLFNIFETYGFPIEMALDELGIEKDELRMKYQREFDKAKEKHQELSRKGSKGKFKGGLADSSEITKRYHTATHLLLRALQEVLGDHVHQRGSNITEERLRFDFSQSEQLTDEQKKEVERLVNDKIKAGLKVLKKVMPKEEALKIGAECEFPEKYPDQVSIYEVEGFTKEFCGGPHVENTKELAKSGKFRIIKEESVGSGVRRIKAVLQ